MQSLGRVVCLVADGLGVGEAPDAKDYGDRGANTLGHVCAHVGGLKLPTLERLGMGLMGDFLGLRQVSQPAALIGRLAEKSAGKDTTTGHWEIAGIVTTKPYATFPEGFPKGLVESFVQEAKLPGVLANRPASGTQIISELGEEHLRSGKPILYTSADSVFQLAAHEKVFGLERLYEICKIARRLSEPFHIGRVIARPFLGNDASNFKRTENRRDYALAPPRNCLDRLEKRGVEVCGVGKIEDIFDHRGLSQSNHTGNNRDSLRATLDFLEKTRNKESFIFANLVDFDMLYGHRRDPVGFAKALVELDTFLPKLLAELQPNDMLILTGDHGCDPTFRGTDHTREYVPLLAYRSLSSGGKIGDRDSFADIAATLEEGFGIQGREAPSVGKSFWKM